MSVGTGCSPRSPPTMRPMADRDVRVYEVGPRDGLQNEKTPIPTEAKLRFIGLLADAGLREIEATSFVSPRQPGLWVKDVRSGNAGTGTALASLAVLAFNRWQGLSGRLILTVTVSRNGDVEGVLINKSSGKKLLDQAAVEAVRLSSPFAPLPQTGEDIDLLDITRTWDYKNGNVDTR